MPFFSILHSCFPNIFSIFAADFLEWTPMMTESHSALEIMN